MNKKQKNNQGFALLLSIIISSVALAIGLSMLQITLKQLSLGTTTKGSEIAFQAAGTGMECLRFTRNDTGNDFTSGSVDFKCLVSPSVTVNKEPATPANIFLYKSPSIDWNVNGNKCIEIEIYIFDASGASAPGVTYALPSGDKTCSEGDICTYGFSRGYNRGCSELTGSIFAVQRELTVEF